MIEKDLRARSARTGIPHGPKIVLVSHSAHAIRVKADFIHPDIPGFIVTVVDRHPELVLRQFEHLGQKLPTKSNRFTFEIVAEAEIAQHFEKCVVPCRITDVI